jgi:peroxiredoxin (alkyl hydroperoxide reductase subunit C)
MIKLGDQFPKFNLKAVVSSDLKTAFTQVSSESYPNQWQVVFFWPKDFTFVCPTELAEFGKLNDAFKERDTQILGVSTDSEFVHLAWRQHKEELGDLPYPMLSDIRRDLSASLGILDTQEGVSQRATFIVDPQGITRFIMVTDMSVGRNTKEVLRVLDALQTEELCACNWQKGDEPISVKGE